MQEKRGLNATKHMTCWRIVFQAEKMKKGRDFF